MVRFLALVLLSLVGCAPPQDAPTEYLVEFQAQCENEPVAEVAVSLNGRQAGATDDQGHLQVTVAGREGQVLPLRVECPDRCRSADVPRTVRLVTVHNLTDPDRPAGIAVPIQCLPADRAAAVVVWAPDAPNVAVLLYGQEVARTDEAGVAHLQVRLPPYSRFALELDTRQLPRLRPQNPTKSFSLSNREEVFLFEQPFVVQAEPRRAKRRRRQRRRQKQQAAPRQFPTRL